MDSSKIIVEYLGILEQVQKKYSLKEWYKTYLANKHRFYPNTERLLSLIQNKPVITENFSRLTAFKKTLFFLMKFGYQLVIIKLKEKSNLKKIRTFPEINVVKTFSYDSSFNKGVFTDPFLGDLYKYLGEKKDHVIIVHEHLGRFKTYSENKIVNPICINLYAFISWKTYIIQYFSLLKKFLTIRSEVAGPVANFIEKNFSEESISPQFCMHDMHFDAFKNLMSAYNTSRIYSTFENNGWEKMLMLAKKELSVETQIIVHQHVPIAPSALNYYLTKEDIKLLPDRIVTVGKVLKDFLISLNYPAEKIAAGCALRLKLSEHPLPENEQRTSLIALDGIPQAAVALNSVIKNAAFFKSLNWKFIVRFHPVLNLEGMSPYLISPLSNYDIFEVSRAGLEEDILRTDSVFYWGSSVAFEAMYSGRIVIHTPGDEILSNDPITLNGGLHFVATDMEKTIRTILDMNDDEYNTKKMESIEYCRNYFGMPGPETLKAFD